MLLVVTGEEGGPDGDSDMKILLRGCERRGKSDRSRRMSRNAQDDTWALQSQS
jgi:hypothetical protein